MKLEKSTIGKIYFSMNDRFQDYNGEINDETMKEGDIY